MSLRRIAAAAVFAAAVLSTLGFHAEPREPAIGDRIECASPLGGDTRGGTIIGEKSEGDSVSYLVDWDDGRTAIIKRIGDCVIVPAGPEAEPAQPEPAEPEQPEAEQPEAEQPPV